MTVASPSQLVIKYFDLKKKVCFLFKKNCAAELHLISVFGFSQSHLLYSQLLSLVWFITPRKCFSLRSPCFLCNYCVSSPAHVLSCLARSPSSFPSSKGLSQSRRRKALSVSPCSNDPTVLVLSSTLWPPSPPSFYPPPIQGPIAQPKHLLCVFKQSNKLEDWMFGSLLWFGLMRQIFLEGIFKVCVCRSHWLLVQEDDPVQRGSELILGESPSKCCWRDGVNFQMSQLRCLTFVRMWKWRVVCYFRWLALFIVFRPQTQSTAEDKNRPKTRQYRRHNSVTRLTKPCIV